MSAKEDNDFRTNTESRFGIFCKRSGSITETSQLTPTYGVALLHVVAALSLGTTAVIRHKSYQTSLM